jgi:hypothetical protein
MNRRIALSLIAGVTAGLVTQPEVTNAMGIFFKQSALFTRYAVTLQFRDKVMGGIPKDPKLIEGWLRAKAGISDVEEVRVALLRTLGELGAEVNPDMNYAEIEQAAEKVAGTKETSGFKRDPRYGLYLESRQLKAALVGPIAA